MYAVIETGGKQYRVQEGDVITIEKLNVTAEEKVEFDKVLLFSDGDSVQVGAPYVDALKVYGTVVENGKGQKVIIFKYKSKKDYRKKQGHRQPYTMVQIDSLGGKPSAKKEVEAAAPSVEEDKKPAAKKATADKADKKPAVKKADAEKKPAAKKAAKSEEAEAKEV